MALKETGYETPTPIQLQAIPAVLTGKDVLGIAQTGTGKTAAFALPILHRLAADRRPTPARGTRALILSPTRELASQIADSFRTYGKHLGFTVAVVFGGVSERPQTDRLKRGVDILVATPGRLLDHMGQRNVSMSMAEIFVLDEADQMLDLGFFKPIRRIVADLPKVRQNLFFSATMPKEIEELTKELLKNPTKVAVTPQATTVERVSQRVIRIEQNKKKALLAQLLLDDAAMQRTLVFTRTKRGADRVAKHLTAASVVAAAIHGNKSQAQREAALHSFKTGRTRVLVATDIAARGIDIDEVTHVVNFELPEVPESYVHRIGRTARAGASGSAVSFCDEAERHLLRDIERLTRQAITSEDRRNDHNLVADKAAAKGSRDDETDRPARGGRGQRPFGGAGRGAGRGGERSEGRPSRPAYQARAERADRPAGERPARPAGDRPAFKARDQSRERSGDRGGDHGARTGARPFGDRPRRDGDKGGERTGGERGAGDRVWSNHGGGKPDREPRAERSEHRGPPRGENRGEHRGPPRGEHRGERRDDTRSAEGGRPPFRQRDDKRPDQRREDRPRPEGERRQASGDRPERAERPHREGPPREGRSFEARGPRREGDRPQGNRNDAPRRGEGRGEGRSDGGKPRFQGQGAGGREGRGGGGGAGSGGIKRPSAPYRDRDGGKPSGGAPFRNRESKPPRRDADGA